MARDYENAVNIIDSRRRRSRPQLGDPESKSLQSKPGLNRTPDLRGTPSIVGMSEWLRMLGHSNEDINNLNIIHVAGTKGKGSTCAFTESFLRAHGRRTGFPSKTGLYTSPHLILPEERIRINAVPLGPELFAKYFFEVYDSLPQLSGEYDPENPVVERGPRFLQLYALFAFHVFTREKVSTAIFETHNGGEYDATNVVQKPVVTAITSLGMDHVEMLGPTIENIAWHKSGIYKPGAIALSTIQESAPAKVLEKRAKANGEVVRFVDEDQRLPLEAMSLKPAVQKKNASLAVAAAEALLRRTAPLDHQDLTAEDLRMGVEQWSWPGRFQIIPEGKRTWFLDAAHNEMSVKIAAQWFVESGAELDKSASRILMFSHISELRDSVGLLGSLAKALKESNATISHVIFSTYDESDERKSFSKTESPELFRETWRSTFSDTRIWDEPTVQGAIALVKKLGNDDPATTMQTLITGSQHLVGPALRILQAT